MARQVVADVRRRRRLSDLDPLQIAALRRAALDGSYVSLGRRRTSSPHEFYRYPARFSPEFARAAIACLSRRGETVLDPFVGGGTTAVEAMRLGRVCIAADLNPLATLVTAAKTTPLNAAAVGSVADWLDQVAHLNLRDGAKPLDEWASAGYFKDLATADTWRIRKLVALALDRLPTMDVIAKRFCRCVVLRTAQWALDMRGAVPTAAEFREALHADGTAMLASIQEWTEQLDDPIHQPIVVDVGLPGLADAMPSETRPPTLVLTSPPYPGVYVNYHRWKLRGRREIPAPYWIAGREDGNGLAYYTMGARSDRTLATYFAQLEAAYADLVRLMDQNSVLVQLVGFNDVEAQLPRYLDVMSTVGLEEVAAPGLCTGSDGRLWRDVPNRRWWTEAASKKGVAPHTSREVVLLHQLVR